MAMEMLKAREKIDANNTALWPNIKPENRKQYHKTLLKEAGYNTAKRVATASDLRRILGD